MNTLKGLEQLGLSTKAAEAYAALLRLQHASAHQVAKEADIERTTIYKVLDELVGKSLATKTIKGTRIVYLAEPPIKLKQHIEKQAGIFEQILPMLVALQGKSSEKPIVKLFEDIESIKRAVMDTLNCREKLRRDFASVESIVDLLGQRFIDRQIEERVKRGIRVRSLRRKPDSESIQNKDWYLKSNNDDLLREVRYLSEVQCIEPVIFISDNTITVVSSKKESFALVIESKELSQAMKVLFDIAWSSAANQL